MDHSEDLTTEMENQNIANSEGASLLNGLETQDQLEEQKRQNGKFQSAIDGSDLNSTGPSLGDYDYENEFNEGNSFKPDEEGGIVLSNKNIKPGTREIAGYDMITGERFKNDYPDEDGYIQSGMDELQSSNVNTKTGAPPEDMLSLTKIAKGINGTYEDFVKAAKGPWSNEQLAIAWDSKESANRVMEDVKNLGIRYSKPEEGQDSVPYRSQGIEEGIDETELVSNAVWIQSGRKFIDYFNPDGAAGMTDEEVHDFNLSTMSQFNWNIPMMMFMAEEVAKSGDKELGQAFLFMMDQNEATYTSMNSVGRALGGVGGDITTYMTLGGGIILSRLAGASIKAGIKQTISKMLSVTAFETTLGGTVGAIDSISRQTVEGAAGERDELDAGQVAKSAGVNAAVNAVIGVGTSFADPAIRKFGVDTTKKAMDNLSSPGPGKMGLSGQKGAIELGGEKKFTPTVVEFRSKLIEEIDKGIKGETISVKKLKNKIQLWVNEGKIQQQEVDWSGINQLERDNISISEARKIIGANRPVPQVNPVAETRFDSNSFGNPEGGYRERVISVNKIGPYQGPEGHFGSSGTIPEGNANVGHLRLANSLFDGKRGTMLLEAQSDIRKIPRHETSSKSAMAEKVKITQEERALRIANVNVAKLKSDWNANLIELGQKYNLDPQTKDYEFQVLAKLNNAERAKLDKMINLELKAEVILNDATNKYEIGRKDLSSGRIPFTPFRDRKSSNDLMFRSAVMDAMNDGSEFLSWPKTPEQVSIIEGWGDNFIPGSPEESALREFLNRMKGATDTYTKDLPKIAKAHGFKVEEYVPDEFKNKTRSGFHPDRPDPEGTISEWQNWYESMWGVTLDVSDDLSNSIVTARGSSGEILVSGEVTEVFDYLDDFLDGAKFVSIPFEDNVFYRIVFDDASKTKWKEDGAAMYSFGAPVAVGAGASQKNQDRDDKGRFK